MTELEYRTWLIEEIMTDRKSWCIRNKVMRDDLRKKSTKVLETIYDFAKSRRAK